MLYISKNKKTYIFSVSMSTYINVVDIIYIDSENKYKEDTVEKNKITKKNKNYVMLIA